MGKTSTPGKWIKNLLLGKRSSKSSGKEKSTNKGETLVSSKVSVSELTVSAPFIKPALVGTGVSNEVDSEIREAAQFPSESVMLSSSKEDGPAEVVLGSGSQEIPERMKQEQAATKAQSAYRGYVARRAFRTLKGIIRLQALIRGHLVRRQAVSTLLCVKGIVKLQALIRGQRVRHSDLGLEVDKIHLGAKCLKNSGLSASSQVERLSTNAFAQKLLVSLPTAIPLHLQYDQGEPNSSWVWLGRWTRSCFWEPVFLPKKKIDSKSRGKVKKVQKIETEQAKPKGSVRRLSSENGSNRVTSDSERPKHNVRKVSRHPVSSVQEHPQNEVEKTKSNIKKISGPKKKVSNSKEISDPKLDISNRSDIDNEVPKDSTENALASSAPDGSVQGTNEMSEKMKHLEVSVSEHSDLERSMVLPSADDPTEKLDDHHSADTQPMEKTMDNNVTNEEVRPKTLVVNSEGKFISNGDQKTSLRRASLPVKLDHQENGIHNTPRVPSYMAPTESARARLKGQGSPRFSRDVIEKNVITRRHSLSSSTNSKLSSLSPRPQRLSQGKGAIRTDRSLSSSRESFDKVIQPDWRR